MCLSLFRPNRRYLFGYSIGFLHHFYTYSDANTLYATCLLRRTRRYNNNDVICGVTMEKLLIDYSIMCDLMKKIYKTFDISDRINDGYYGKTVNEINELLWDICLWVKINNEVGIALYSLLNYFRKKANYKRKTKYHRGQSPSFLRMVIFEKKFFNHFDIFILELNSSNKDLFTHAESQLIIEILNYFNTISFLHIYVDETEIVETLELWREIANENKI